MFKLIQHVASNIVEWSWTIVLDPFTVQCRATVATHQSLWHFTDIFSTKILPTLMGSIYFRTNQNLRWYEGGAMHLKGFTSSPLLKLHDYASKHHGFWSKLINILYKTCAKDFCQVATNAGSWALSVSPVRFLSTVLHLLSIWMYVFQYLIPFIRDLSEISRGEGVGISNWGLEMTWPTPATEMEFPNPPPGLGLKYHDPPPLNEMISLSSSCKTCGSCNIVLNTCTLEWGFKRGK